MDEELRRRLDTIEARIDATFKSAEKTRKYFQWVLIITVVTVVLPLIVMMFALPSLMSGYTAQYSELMQGL